MELRLHGLDGLLSGPVQCDQVRPESNLHSTGSRSELQLRHWLRREPVRKMFPHRGAGLVSLHRGHREQQWTGRSHTIR